MRIETLRIDSEQGIPAALLAELTALYASNRAFHALSGDFPDPDGITAEQVAKALARESAHPDVEILLARSEDGAGTGGGQGTERGHGTQGRNDGATGKVPDGATGTDGEDGSGGGGPLLGLAITLARHPDPADPDPWLGLLLIDAGRQREGYGRELAERVEARFRAAGRTALRLAALDNNPDALAFWTSLGYEAVGHRGDLRLGRPCTVLRKALRTPRRAARVAVLDPGGAVFLFRYDNEEVGVHWAMPGGGIEPGESRREGALRELREETGWTDLEPGPRLCTWEHDFTRAGVPVRQHEVIYVAHGPRREPLGGDHVRGTHSEEGILAWRWWTPEELAATKEALWPPDLARLLAEAAGPRPAG
ncbi:GNAT family N-acetyltransferase [Streptomyces sp. NPDC008313]|uniref:GNAT family N-acetyltransferase n=1 Tax=Streptomyces sp. NPDC008313 TaxID=3364826 RepID=UPI0036E68F10